MIEPIQQPQSGCNLQPRVAVAATLGIELQSASTPAGLRPLLTPITQRSPERQRWAGGRNRFAVLDQRFP